MKIIFWLSVFLIIHSYILYPLLLFLTGKNYIPADDIEEEELPRVTVIIPARNEEKHIALKVKNTLGIDYPKDKVEIIVASDNSGDKTVERAREAGGNRVKIIEFTERKGKLGVINRCVREADGDFVVLTDANAMFSPYSVRRLVRHFKNRNVGCAGGAKIILKQGGSTSANEGLYWKYESLVKKLETNLSSCTGLDGAIYMVRKSVFPFHREDKLFMDDLATSLAIVKGGYRCVYDEMAMASEQSSDSLNTEYKRKERIAAGALNVVIHNPSLLVPFVSPILFQLLSHKILRWFTFFLMMTALISNILIIGEGSIYTLSLLLQSVFYFLASTGCVLSVARLKSSALFSMPFYFTFTNIAQCTGILKLFTGVYKPYWERTER